MSGLAAALRTEQLAAPTAITAAFAATTRAERRKRAERALTTVVATCYLLGVSTRRMDKLVETLGITGLSESQVSVMAKGTRYRGGGVPQPAAGRRPVHVRRR